MIDHAMYWSQRMSGKVIEGQVVDHCEITASGISDPPQYYLRAVFKSMPEPADMDIDRPLDFTWGPLTEAEAWCIIAPQQEPEP